MSLSEVGVAKLIAERDAAVEARTAAAADLDRVRKALEAKEASMNHTMESFNRNAELQLSREREMSSRLDGAQDKIATLTVSPRLQLQLHGEETAHARSRHQPLYCHCYCYCHCSVTVTS